MPLGSLWVFLACAFGAEILGTMAGFGAATVLTPIAGFFMDMKTAVAVVACFHLCGNASRLYFFRRQIHWTIVKRFGLAGVLLSFVGAHTASLLPSPAIRVLLGAFLVVCVVLEARPVTALRVPATTTMLMGGGIASGFIAGLIGTGGAIRSVCLLAFGLPKEAYIGTSAVIALMVDATRLPVYLTQQFIPQSLVPVVWRLTLVAFCGAWVGQRVLRVVSPTRFKQFVLLMLVLMGAKLIIDGWRGMR